MKRIYTFLLAISLCFFFQCQLPTSEFQQTRESILIPKKTYYTSGELKTEFFINQDSLKEGRYQEFLPDGKLVRIIEYEEGRPHGDYITFHLTGGTSSQHHYQYGLPEGPYFWYYPNSQIRQQGIKVNGHDHGHAKSFFENGALKSLINYHMGEKYQTSLWYFPNGQLQRFAFYGRLGQKCFQIDWNKNGEIQYLMGKPIADLQVKTDDFKRQVRLGFIPACPPQSECTVSFWKEVGKRSQKLELRQNEATYNWSEQIVDAQPFFYKIQVEVELPGQNAPQIYQQKIRVLPYEKMEYTLF